MKLLSFVQESPIIRTPNQQFSSDPFSMSKLRSLVSTAMAICAVAAFFSGSVYTQDLTVEIAIDAENKSASISGKFASNSEHKNLSFVREAIGSPAAAARISGVVLRNEAGREVPFRRFNPAEYVAEAVFAKFSYQVDLKPNGNARSSAHASWIGPEAGILMLDDMLPVSNGNDKYRSELTIKLPPQWKVWTTERSAAASTFVVEDTSRAVFVLGREMREPAASPKIVIGSGWHFSDGEVADTASKIYREYLRIFKDAAGERHLVVLLPFPQANVAAGTWEAETRGSTVLLISADTPFKGQSLQRLHEQLRHELFHLWLPNGVNLAGKYDWFYEGFALYQSLKTAVAMNQIRFDDFLDTLSRAHNISRSSSVRRSLLDLSAQRWDGGETEVYARGMVVAFLSDLAILQESSGKSSVESVFREIFAAHKPPAATVDANDAVLKALAKYQSTGSIIAEHVRGVKAIEWGEKLAAAGIENAPGSSRTSLRVMEKLERRQRALLDKLGYNNWRKLNRK